MGRGWLGGVFYCGRSLALAVDHHRFPLFRTTDGVRTADGWTIQGLTNYKGEGATCTSDICIYFNLDMAGYMNSKESVGVVVVRLASLGFLLLEW
jgi:hypothetical protein